MPTNKDKDNKTRNKDMEQEYGFGNDGGNNATWITVAGGKLAVRAQEGDDGAVERKYTVKSTGEEKSVWEYQSSHFVGDVIGGGFEDTKFGSVFYVDLQTPDKRYQLRLPCPGRLFEQFAKRIPNIDLSKPLWIGAFMNDQDRQVLFLKHGGDKVAVAYTKDNPNGLPEAVKKEKMGKVTWDFEAQEEFLYQSAKAWAATIPQPEYEGADQVACSSPEPVGEEMPF